MMSFHIALLYIVYLQTSNSGCIPENTCFASAVGSVVGGVHDSGYDKSFLFICNNSAVTKYTFDGSSTCSKGNDFSKIVAAGGIISEGDTTIGSASGSITTDYLQGESCPSLTGKSETCSQFMVLKHRGNKTYQDWFTNGNEPTIVSRPYEDIGNNCTNYTNHLPNYSTNSTTGFSQYTSVVIPVGCHAAFLQLHSINYWCDENGWGYNYYDAPNCASGTGSILSAQSRNFVVDKCGYFSEWTHCNNPNDCSDGLHDYWWYWYDLECCPIAGRTCYGAAKSPITSTASPASGPSEATSTSSPSDIPSIVPSLSTNNPTASPITSSPTTKNPTSSPSFTPTSLTGYPSKSPAIRVSTKKPTNAPTSRPIQDIFGNTANKAQTLHCLVLFGYVYFVFEQIIL